MNIFDDLVTCHAAIASRYSAALRCGVVDAPREVAWPGGVVGRR